MSVLFLPVMVMFEVDVLMLGWICAHTVGTLRDSLQDSCTFYICHSFTYGAHMLHV